MSENDTEGHGKPELPAEEPATPVVESDDEDDVVGHVQPNRLRDHDA
ncbi:MAG TPA: hypothetical protein VHB18_01210 [Mycobacteriales bacterium]|nr:hypothetical protein [Mycobacteriales bacterium]